MEDLVDGVFHYHTLDVAIGTGKSCIAMDVDREDDLLYTFEVTDMFEIEHMFLNDFERFQKCAKEYLAGNAAPAEDMEQRKAVWLEVVSYISLTIHQKKGIQPQKTEERVAREMRQAEQARLRFEDAIAVAQNKINEAEYKELYEAGMDLYNAVAPGEKPSDDEEEEEESGAP